MASQFQNETLIESQIKERYEGVKRLRENIAKNFSEYTELPEQEVGNLMIDGGTILSALQAKEKKIIHEIKEPKIPTGARVVSVGNA